MFANTKQFKNKIKQLQLPWWFNLVKWGIPSLLATITAVVVLCALGGWIAIPEGIQLMQWAVALFSTMQPVVKFVALGLMTLGSFLTTLLMSSIFVRGILFYFTEKAALDGEKVSADLFEQNKELQEAIHRAGEVHEQTQAQLEFLKGFSTAKANRPYEGLSQEAQEPQEEEETPRAANTVRPQQKPISVVVSEEPEPVLVFSRTKSGESTPKETQAVEQQEKQKQRSSATV